MLLSPLRGFVSGREGSWAPCMYMQAGVCQLKVLTIVCSCVGVVKVTSLPTKYKSPLEVVFRVRAQTEMKIRTVHYRYVSVKSSL